MAVVTLTSDLGTRDYYVSAVKGELMKAISKVEIIDISHDIEPFNILHGAFVLKNSYGHFPQKSIHLVSVNAFHQSPMSTLAIHHDNHFFIGPDNGLFGLVWDEVIPKEIYRAKLNEMEETSTLPVKDLYVRLAAHLASGKKLDEIGDRVASFVRSTIGRPTLSENYLRGTIIYFDYFGNAIVNIRREEFDRVGKGRKLIAHFKRFHDVDRLSSNYGDVEESGMLCLFNSAGYLEIAINKGNAKSLLNLNSGDTVQIEFHS